MVNIGIRVSNGNGEELFLRDAGSEVGLLVGKDGPAVYVYKRDLPLLIAKLACLSIGMTEKEIPTKEVK